MICPYGTGRVFTNTRLYYQHVRDWPEISKINGLNLDGTPISAPKATEEPAPASEASETESESKRERPSRTRSKRK